MAEDSHSLLTEKVDFLRQPGSYPEETSRVDVIETHMSFVFLIDRYVYKLKKPIRFKLLNLVTLEDRRRNCEAEVRLNRRLAPDVYLGVVPLGRDERGALLLGSEASVSDWLVKMKRLPAARMLDAVIEAGKLRRDDVERLARVLVAFYGRARPVDIEPPEYRARYSRNIEDATGELGELSSMPRRRIEAVAKALLDFVTERGAGLDARARGRRIVDGHGDLRPEHVCLLPEPAVIDCVEFSVELRSLDPLEELGFLSAECRQMGGPSFIEPVLLDIYARETGDEAPRELVRFYESFRMFLRAQTAIWHLRDPGVKDRAKWEAKAEQYLSAAEELLGAADRLEVQPSRSSTSDPPS